MTKKNKKCCQTMQKITIKKIVQTARENETGYSCELVTKLSIQFKITKREKNKNKIRKSWTCK